MNNFNISREDLTKRNYNSASCDTVKDHEVSCRGTDTVTPEVMLAIILFDLIKAGEAE